ncbi:hypothetical protein ASC89_22515 [Devosia sp. Root413D1]|uniref:VCBS domain-containing protein n=2 Tax=unclassified Devosia TaxID=196773 RepID=UPI0006F49430|nr:VCBS domain-containing protein [Devosia sp. Root413D1]KQW75707.1 hypothetical protein ASC89_22515 [Devosia sp. Root413D1]
MTIKITGTNDAADLSADVEELTEGDTAAAISTSGQLTISDVDSAETFVAQTDAAGTYGTFSIGADGAWTYTADTAHNEFVDGEVYTDTFPVESADGTPTSVTIKITGTNDAFVDGEVYTDTFPVESADGTPTSVTIKITGTNDAPTLDLDASAAGTGYAATSAAGAATAIVDSDVTIADVDNTELTSATITVTNHKTGDLLSIAGSLPAGISASSYNSSTGVLTLTGIGTLAQYQAVLQQLRFSNGESHPDITDRDITVTVSDGIASSNIAHSVISVTAPNEAPDAKPDSFTTTENGISGGTSSVPLAVGNVLTNAPADSDPEGDGLSVTSVTGVAVNETDLQLSTPVITSEAAGAGEAARFMITTTTGVAHLAVMTTGAVNLWTTAGDAFQGLGTGESATLSFTYGVSDGHGGTDTATAQITINGSNDTPTASNVVKAVADTSATNAGTVVASGNLVTASAAADPDGDTPLTISNIQGPSDGSAITVTAGGVVAHGTYGDLTVSSNGTYSYTAKPALDALQTGNNPTEAFSFVVSDGHGGTTTQTLTFNISGANDTPTGLNFVMSTLAASADNGNNGLNDGTVIGTFQPTGDPDSSTFTFGFIDPVPAGFTINATTGVLSTNGTVQVNDTTPYSVTVTASDGTNTFTTPLKIWVVGAGNDVVTAAGTDIDIMFGSNGDDVLNGTAGSDALIGGANNDSLTGGLGADQLHGGAHNDSFIYTATSESGVGAGNRDTIFDFASGDTIDLSAIDANTNTAGNGTFLFVAAATATITANSVTWHQAGGNTYIHGDNSGDGVADFEIELLGTRTMVSGDFGL